MTSPHEIQSTIPALQARVSRAETREDLAEAEAALATAARRAGVDVVCSRCDAAISPRAAAPHSWCEDCAGEQAALLADVRGLLARCRLEDALEVADRMEVVTEDLQEEIAQALLAWVPEAQRAVADGRRTDVLEEAGRILRYLDRVPLPDQDPAVGTTPSSPVMAVEVLEFEVRDLRCCTVCVRGGVGETPATTEWDLAGGDTMDLCGECAAEAGEGAAGDPIELPEWLIEAAIVEVEATEGRDE